MWKLYSEKLYVYQQRGIWFVCQESRDSGNVWAWPKIVELHLFAVRSCILNVSGQYLRHNTDSWWDVSRRIMGSPGSWGVGKHIQSGPRWGNDIGIQSQSSSVHCSIWGGCFGGLIIPFLTIHSALQSGSQGYWRGGLDARIPQQLHNPKLPGT